MTQVQAVLRRLGPAGPLAVVAASLPALGGFTLLGTLKWSGPWLQAHGGLGLMLYVAGFMVLAGLAVLPTYALAVLGGWAFGLAVGCPAAIGGFLGASAIGYLIARRASGDRVVGIIQEHRKWQAVYEALLGSGFTRTLLIVTLLRLPPNSPFAITNLVLAATRVPPLTYLLGTLLGMSPRTAIAVFVGAQVGFSGRPAWVVVSGIVVAIVVIGIIGTLANQAIAKVTAAEPERG